MDHTPIPASPADLSKTSAHTSDPLTPPFLLARPITRRPLGPVPAPRTQPDRVELNTHSSEGEDSPVSAPAASGSLRWAPPPRRCPQREFISTADPGAVTAPSAVPWSSSEQRVSTQARSRRMSVPGHLLSPGHLPAATGSFPRLAVGPCNRTVQFPARPSHFLECWMTLDKLFTASEPRAPYLSLLTTEPTLPSFRRGGRVPRERVLGTRELLLLSELPPRSPALPVG